VKRAPVQSVALPLSVRLKNGEECPITNMFDYDGDDTSDPREAYCVVAGPTRAGKWVAALTLDEERAAVLRPN
jgi:hypothetical protein